MSTNELKCKIAFSLPNGSALKYAFPGDKGNQFNWYRTYDNKRLMDKIKKKTSLPKVGLWSSKTNQHLIAADFDNLPEGFANYERLKEYLKSKFKNRGRVTSTPSNKAKVFFVVQITNSFKMNKEIASDVLELLFRNDAYDLYNYLDLTKPALSVAFVTPNMVQDLKNISSLEPIFIEGYSKVSENKITKNDLHKFKLYSKEIPEYLKYFQSSDKREYFARIILECGGLCRETGFQLPITKLSSEVKVSPKTISTWLKKLISSNLLECINRKYKPGKISRTYKAKGELFKFFKNKLYKNKSYNIPTQIKDGEWNNDLFTIAWNFKDNPNQYFNYVKNIPGYDQKDRSRQAEKTFKRVQEYIRGNIGG